MYKNKYTYTTYQLTKNPTKIELELNLSIFSQFEQILELRRMVYPHVVFERTVLYERVSAHQTHEPSVVIVDPHMFPQRLQPRVRFLAHIALIYPFPAVFNRVLL